MKTKLFMGFTALLGGVSLVGLVNDNPLEVKETKRISNNDKPCVFMTVMGEQSSEGFAAYKMSADAKAVVQKGENWLVEAQNSDGGWGAGSHSNQKERNPHAVLSDPATTAMSAMALYRCGYTINKGPHQETLQKALHYLLNEIEKNKGKEFITEVRGTQIQRKLGEHIDAIMTLQFFNQILPSIKVESQIEKVKEGIQVCVDEIEKSMGDSGKVKGSGWAGVLQSSFANSSLEMAAKNKDIKVNQQQLDKARAYQKSNYNTDSEKVDASEGAGVVLYAVSSSVRGSAVESKEAVEIMQKAKKEGKIEDDAVLNEANLKRIGVSDEKAKSYDVANKVYKSAKVTAMDDKVLSGFGNNGGEEFLSFLQTGESMVVNKDDDWKKWYDNIGGRIMKIQNSDGSWNGHHCITSPAFCTATSLLILTIENDIQTLQK